MAKALVSIPAAFGDGYRAGYAQGIKSGAPHAHWIKFDNGSEYSDRWQCSECKRTARCETWGKKCEYERCPHCGAFMDDGGAAHD